MEILYKCQNTSSEIKGYPALNGGGGASCYFYIEDNLHPIIIQQSSVQCSLHIVYLLENCDIISKFKLFYQIFNPCKDHVLYTYHYQDFVRVGNLCISVFEQKLAFT